MPRDRPEIESLLSRVHDDPAQVLVEVDALLRRAPDRTSRVLADWVRGLAHRELGDPGAARDLLEAALGAAVQLGDASTAGRVAVSLALTVSQLGDHWGALALLDAHESSVAGTDLAHLHLQRGLVLMYLERPDDGLRSTRRARELFVAADDGFQTARADMNAAVLLASLHRYRQALDAATNARTRLDAEGHEMLAAQAAHNCGYFSFLLGRLPEALALMRSAAERLEAISGPDAALVTVLVDRAEVLLAANLAVDACREIDRALDLTRRSENEVLRAETLLRAAICHAQAGHSSRALELSEQAHAAFDRSGRPSWGARASLVQLRSCADRDGLAAVEPERLDRVASQLAESRWTTEAMNAALLASDRRLLDEDVSAAIAALSRAMGSPGRVLSEDVALRSLVRAELHRLRGDDPSARRAITRGLRGLQRTQSVMADPRMRATSSEHGRRLAELGVELAARDRRWRDVVVVDDAARSLATSLGVAADEADDVVVNLLAEYRERRASIDAADAGRDRVAVAHLGAIEHELLARTAEATARSAESTSLPSVAGDLRGDQVVCFAQARSGVFAVELRGGRVRAGASLDLEIADDLEGVTFGLHRLNRSGSSPAARAAATDMVETCAESIGRALGFDESNPARDRRLVLLPIAPLFDVPWAALPQLRGRPVAVVPQLASAVPPPAVTPPSRWLLVAGPGLEYAAAEVTQLSEMLGDDAVVASERWEDQIGGCDVLHLACHGSFRAENPMFSELALPNGPMTVLDLQRLGPLPRVVVLSACSVGRTAHQDRMAMLGFASVLLQLGVESVIAPVIPVNDEWSLPFTMRLHDRLRAGASPSAALAAAADPTMTVDPVAAGYVCFGV